MLIEFKGVDWEDDLCHFSLRDVKLVDLARVQTDGHFGVLLIQDDSSYMAVTGLRSHRIYIDRPYNVVLEIPNVNLCVFSSSIEAG
jgi:hypothetical protein